MPKKKSGDIPEARCNKCGHHAYGWALLQPEHQTCPKCGGKLKLVKHPTADTFTTMAEVIGHRCCVNPEVVERWLEKKGYGVDRFSEVINEVNTNFELWLAEILECSKGVKQERRKNV